MEASRYSCLRLFWASAAVVLRGLGRVGCLTSCLWPESPLHAKMDVVWLFADGLCFARPLRARADLLLQVWLYGVTAPEL